VELARGDDSWRTLGSHLFDDRWSEVVLLFAGWLRWRQGPRPVKRFIERVLATGPDLAGRARAVGLLGRVLKDVRPFGGDPSVGTGYEAALTETLALFAPGGPEVDQKTRMEVGEALGQAGDPRLEGDNRVALPGGRFLMGAQADDLRAPGHDGEAYSDEAPVHSVTLSPFTIGRYPVTVAEFRLFVEARERGYLDPRRWAPEGWAWRENEGCVAPGSWERQLSHPNRPVVEVSWYEADAYCRWAGGRLPTEAEWEYSARGMAGRKFPWGDGAPTGRHANFAMRVGQPTPVGIYPGGATPERVFDLAGNVWEWCADWFAGRYREGELIDPPGPTQGTFRVLRGGSFYNEPSALRGAYRHVFHPGVRGADLGFRLVWGSAPGLD
jgi:formylglycine-generating enzyme required for sulfatase activity